MGDAVSVMRFLPCSQTLPLMTFCHVTRPGFVLGVICLREVSKTVKSKFCFEKKDCNFDALIKILHS